jgi:acyl carrier protein
MDGTGGNDAIAAAVRGVLHARVAAARGELPDDLPLGEGGLGLDSIALVELLLTCERRFGAPPSAQLLEGPPLTVGGLVAHVRAAVLD